MKPDNDFFLPFEGLSDSPGGGTGHEFWEHVADLLEQIEKNTRTITSASGNVVNAPDAGRTTRVVERPSSARGKSVLPLDQPVASQTARAERTASRRAPLPTPPSPHTAPPSRGQTIPPPIRSQDNARTSGRESVKPPAPSQLAQERPPHAENAGAASPTKSQQEHVRRREEAVVNEQSRGMLDILKKNLAGWDGSVATPDKDDLQNVAGLAAGGPVWSAIKEVKEAVESSDDDDTSLLGILKKTLADKTGVTGAKERLEQIKNTARAKVVSWAGGSAEGDGTRQSKAGRDKKGRFLTAQKTATSPEAKVAEESYSLATQEAAADKKRHDELIEAVKGSGNGAAGSGLFGKDGLLDRVRGRREGSGRRAEGRRRNMGSTTGRRAQSAGGARGRRRGKLGLLAGGLAALGGGASLLSGDPTDIALDLGEAALTTPGAGKAVVTTAGKTAGRMGKVAGLGAKGVAGAAKAIPVAGQVLAAGMAIYEGVQGWNDTAMQQEAFGLGDEQEASTGQKASAATANVLDMGGLFTGAASLLGFDVSTADMAKGIYDAGGSIGSSLSSAWDGMTGFFSSDTKDANSSVIKSAEVASGAIAKDDSQGLFDSLVTALSDLTAKIDEETKKKESESSLFPSIGGLFSGVSSWMSGKLSPERGGGARSSGTQAQKYNIDPNAKIGDSIARFESGTSGVHAIGYDRTGGTSYGKYQLSSTTSTGGEGSMQGFLRDMQAQGGEKAAIAQRILSAGSLNTGGRGGAAVEQYKKEVAANTQLMEDSQREYMLKANYAPAMSNVSDSLRTRIEGSKALQEAMFSTAVQHGAGNGRTTGAGASNIWNKVYREGMSDDDLTRAVYAERGSRFGSSTAAVQQSVRNRFGREQDLIRSMSQQEKATKDVHAAVQSTPEENKLQAAASASINAGTQEAIDRGVSYQMGSRNTASGKIDCSGFVLEQSNAFMDATNAALGKEVYSDKAKSILNKDGTAAGIIKNVGEATGGLLTGDALAPENIKEGMMIGLDASASAGADRYKGIDHIAQTFKDSKTGQMMVSESSSGDIEGKGRNGVMSMPYDKWREHQIKKGRSMYGVDPTKLADASALAGAVVAESKSAEPKPVEASPVLMAQYPQGVPTQVATLQQEQAQTLRYPEPEPLRPVSESIGSRVDVSAQMVALLSQLLDVTRQQGQKQERDTEAANTPNIPMEYDNTYCVNIAHDRA